MLASHICGEETTRAYGTVDFQKARRSHEFECTYESSRHSFFCHNLSPTLAEDKNERTLVKDKSQGLLTATAVSDAGQ